MEVANSVVTTQDVSFLDNLKNQTIDLLDAANEALQRRLNREGPGQPPLYSPSGVMTNPASQSPEWLPYIVLGAIGAMLLFRKGR